MVTMRYKIMVIPHAASVCGIRTKVLIPALMEQSRYAASARETGAWPFPLVRLPVCRHPYASRIPFRIRANACRAGISRHISRRYARRKRREKGTAMQPYR